jgi:DNA polymerase-4
MQSSRKIIHIDMDCFYAAVETKHNPSLRGKPVGVGGPPESRSVLCTANYEARVYGVRAAMSSSQAVRLCPQLILVPPNFSLYKAESKAVRGILDQYSERVEPLSLDEAYMDVTGAGVSATQIAHEIQGRIRRELGLSASCGVAPNKFLAKVASDWKKPGGLTVISPDRIDSFVRDLPADRIFGVGKKTASYMQSLGIKTCGDLQRMDLLELKRHFGSRAFELFNFSRGHDEREVVTDWERKSLCVEETFLKDKECLNDAQLEIRELYGQWCERMERAQCFDLVKGWSVKIKYHDFVLRTHDRSSRRMPAVEDFLDLMDHLWQQRQHPFRLIGLGVKLGSSSERDQLLLFG